MRKITLLLIPILFCCEQKTSVPVEVCTVSTDSLESTLLGIKRMVLVPSGTFYMGDSLGDETENFVRQVEISGFYMDETPVTYADFQKYVNDGGTVSRYWKYSSYNVPEQPVTGLNWYHGQVGTRGVEAGFFGQWVPLAYRGRMGIRRKRRT